MAIDIYREHIIDLREAARLPVFRRCGRSAHVASIYRYIQRGCRGVRLESIVTPAGKRTSVEAVERFVARLSDAPTDPALRHADLSRDADLAVHELKAEGF